MSASVGLLFSAISSALSMLCPGWQYPHSGTSPSRHAIWSGCCALGESPSIVVTSFPAAWLTGCTHERTALPFTCTVHDPHSAIPHPYFVPVRPIVSRITHSRGVSGSTSTGYIFPLTLSESMTSASQFCAYLRMDTTTQSHCQSNFGYRSQKQIVSDYGFRRSV